MKVLQKSHILMLHEQLVEATGGSHGIREDGMLESALATPFQSFAGMQAYPSLTQKAARLGYGLIRNHPFIDGNKRIGTHAMLVFLALNGVDLRYTQQELSDIILSVAASEAGCEALLQWLTEHEV